MPVLPLPPIDSPGVQLGGGDLPVTSTADVQAEWSQDVLGQQAGPVIPAVIAGQTAMLLAYQDAASYAAAQSDPLRATGEYLDEVGDERGIYRQDGERDASYSPRVNGIPGVADPNDIIAAVNAILAPFTAIQARYSERSDCWFVNNGTAAWSSHVFRGTQIDAHDPGTPIVTNRAPNYPDRLYADAVAPGAASLPNRRPGGARVFGDTFGRYFEIRIPDLAPVDQSVAAVYDGTQTNGGGFFVGNGGSAINTTFTWSTSRTEFQIYDQIISTVERLRGHSIRWRLLVDPELGA